MRGRGAGAPDDLAEFYADQYDRVRGALTLFTGDRRLAEELAQEAFVKTCQHWERVRGMDAPGAWVHRVGINLAISRARRRRNEVRVVQRVGAERDAVAGPADGSLADEALRDALLSLPAEERAVLVLRFYADLPVAEVAAAVGTPEGTVKTRTRRALATLRAGGLVPPDEAGVGADRVGAGPPAPARKDEAQGAVGAGGDDER